MLSYNDISKIILFNTILCYLIIILTTSSLNKQSPLPKLITDDSKAKHTIITTIKLKVNEVILIRNYLQQRKKHQAS
jgi:hypothetical protein